MPPAAAARTLAVWLRDEVLLGDTDGGLDAGYLSGEGDQFNFIFDGDIDLHKLATAILGRTPDGNPA